LVGDRQDRDDAADESELAWGFHTEPAPPTVGELMTPVAFELQASCPLRQAVELLTSRHLHRAPVVDEDGVLVGVVTAGDVLRFLSRRDCEPAEEPTTDADRVAALGFLA